MRRVLIVDDPRLAPRLARLRPEVGNGWDVLIAPAEHLEAWRKTALLSPGARAGSPAQADSLIAPGEAVELFAAASTPEMQATASKLAFRRGSTTVVLPRGDQAADWVFSLYPLSEGPIPRVRGVFEHRAAPAVTLFRESLPVARADRHLAGLCTLPASRLAPEHFEREFIEEIDLFRLLAGDFKTLIAVGVPDSAGGYRSVTFTLGGEQSGAVTWTVQAGAAFAWELRQADGHGPTLTRSIDGEYSVSQAPASGSAESASPFAPWQDVLRAFDDLSAMRRSLKRRRLVELQTETISERAQFKSLMSASGCGLLVATLFGAVALLAAGAAFDPRASLQRTSERAGLVFRADDFQPATLELSNEAAAEWPGMTRRLSQTAAPILIEKSDDANLDRQRVERLTASLADDGVASPASRIELYDFRGGLFVRLLTVCWVLLFLPLGLFLAFQAFLLVAPTQSPGPPGTAASE